MSAYAYRKHSDPNKYIYSNKASLYIFQNLHKNQSFNIILIVSSMQYCFSPFPEVAESVQQELESYRAQEDEVKRLKSIMVRFCLLSWNYGKNIRREKEVNFFSS